MNSKTWGRVDMQVSVFSAVIVALLTFSIFMFQYRITYEDTLRSLTDQSESIYSYIGERLDTATFRHISEKEDVDNPNYKEMHELFAQVKEVTGVMYLYTAKKNAQGDFVYVVDCQDISQKDFRYPGDLIEEEIYPDMERALKGQTVLPDKIKDTGWGKIFITYRPIYEGREVIGVIGIEFQADHQYNTYQDLRRILPVFIVLFSLASCVGSRFLFRQISNPFYKDMSNTDYLTQLKNRNAYQLDMGNRIACKGEAGTGFLVIDLNGLKYVNDTMGHDAGDQYIECIAKAYQNMNTKEGIMYRIGGDEFVVVMPRTNEKKVLHFAAWLEQEFDKVTDKPEFTFSWGYAIYDRGTDASLFSTCRRADKNMYVKKQQFYDGKKKKQEEDLTPEE